MKLQSYPTLAQISFNTFVNIGDTYTKGSGVSSQSNEPKRASDCKEKESKLKKKLCLPFKPWQSWQVVAFSFI
jgi:hypothetical protein